MLNSGTDVASVESYHIFVSELTTTFKFITMTTIFTIQLSDDGLNQTACTNVKALFNEISLTGYEPKTVGVHGLDGLSYSYSNLLKVIRFSQKDCRAFVATIECSDNSNIVIQEIGIRSK